MEVYTLKIKHRYEILTIITIIVTIIILLTSRQKGYSYQQIMSIASYSFDNMPVGDKIIGYYNGYDIYQDYYVEDYDSLVNHSDNIVLVHTEKCEQLGNAVYATVRVKKTLQGTIPKEKKIRIIMPNYITYNAYNGNKYSIDIAKEVHIRLISPCVNMKVGSEYIVFLNEMSGYRSTYRLSTILYSIVPVKEEPITILRVDFEELNRYKNRVKCASDYDYIAIENQPVNRQSIDKDYINRVEKAELLASNYVSLYADICNYAYKAITKKCSINLVLSNSVDY